MKPLQSLEKEADEAGVVPAADLVFLLLSLAPYLSAECARLRCAILLGLNPGGHCWYDACLMAA